MLRCGVGFTLHAVWVKYVGLVLSHLCRRTEHSVLVGWVQLTVNGLCLCEKEGGSMFPFLKLLSVQASAHQ